MTIAKCKKCGNIIITSGHLKNKKNAICIDCLMKSFKLSLVDGHIICKSCGVAVIDLIEANEHLENCSAKDGETLLETNE